MADKDSIGLDVTVVHGEDAPASTPGGRSEIYEIEGTVGQGGGGIVLKARDRRLDRHVALKILSGPNEAMRVRFEREMRITARLQHPGVVPIHDTGLWGDDVPFYAMRLVEGRSLKQVLEERHTLAERLQLLPHLLAVAETMAYAHSQAIIHRDLKPANIIVGAYGETVVIDWGLVKDLAAPVEDDAQAPGAPPELEGATVSGQVVGTPAYMPPEQARGDLVDRRADVYALGALLRELITGQAPYATRDWREMLGSVLRGDLPATASLAPEAPPDLIAVADKAMARDAAARYPDAAAFVVDLRRYLQGDQVGAYAYAPRERLRKWAARRRGVVLTATIAALLLVTMGAISVTRVLRERDDAIASRRQVVGKNNALLREQAARELDQGNALRAYELLQGYPADATDWADVYPLVNRIGLLGLPDFWAHPKVELGPGSGAAVDADGRFVALADAARLEVWNLVTRRPELGLELGTSAKGRVAGLEAITIGPNVYFAIALADGALVVVARGAPTRPERYRPCGRAGLEATASLAHEPSIAVACEDGAVVRIDVTDGTTSTVAHHRGKATAVAFEAPDLIVSVGTDGELLRTRPGAASTSLRVGAPLSIVSAQPACHASVVGTRDGRIVVTSAAPERPPFEQVIASGSVIVSAGIDAGCRTAFGLSSKLDLVLVDLTTHRLIATSKATVAAFYPGREALVTGSERGDLEYWDPGTGWRQSWRASATAIRAALVAANGTIVGVGDVLAAFAPGRIPRTFALAEPAITLATAADESKVWLGGKDGGVGVYDVELDTVTEHAGMHRGTSYVVAGATTLYSVGLRDGCVLSWQDDDAWQPVFCAPGGVADMATAGDAVYVASVAGSVIGTEPGGPLQVASGYRDLRRLGVGSAGRVVVASAAGDVDVLTHDLRRARHGKVDRRLGRAAVLASGRLVAVSPDGPLVDVDSGATLATCPAGALRSWFASTSDRALVSCLDGESIAFPSIDGLARVVQAQAATDVDGSPDGRTLASTSFAGTVTVVDSVTREVRAVTSSIPLGNVELLQGRGLLVAVGETTGVIAIWKLSELPQAYPLDDAKIHTWLHGREDRGE